MLRLNLIAAPGQLTFGGSKCSDDSMIDVGLTHIALPVTDVDKSVAFYTKYARMQIVHRRSEQSTGSDVVWISDKTRPFVIVLIRQQKSMMLICNEA